MSLCLATALASAPAFADEGMYTFDNFPAAKVKAKYGVSVTPQWLDKVRLATARISGCTAVFVSADGLMITNHHCAEPCMEQNSTKERSYVEDGFVAPDRSRELACKAQVADVLIATEDITAKVAKRTGSLDDKRANDERRKLLTDLESECEAAAAADPKLGRLRCESVTLYEGGQYFLYKYKRYSDVRAVFVPEAAVAAFGGDPDNFQFPRWSFDIAILRAWEDGKPARTPNHLSIDFAGPKPGDAVFVSGHPGKTSRLFTVGELDTVRTTTLPFTLLRGYELRGRYLQFAKESATNARITAPSINRLENLMKVRRRQLDALLEGPLMAEKKRREAELRSRVKADKTLHARTGDPWREIDAAEARMRQMFYPYTFIEEGSGFDSQLYRWAKTLVRGTAERDKPNNERLREFTDTRLARVEQLLLTPAPVYPEVERLTMTFGLERMREWLGPDAPIVRQLLVKESPDALAARLVEKSSLADVEVRRTLWKEGRAAVQASQDPLIQLVRDLESQARPLRTAFDDEVEAPLRKASERLARARFAVYGTRVYPDATYTLRLNYGSVRGWNESAATREPFTRLGRMFERATGFAPFALPKRWLAAKDRLDMATLVNFASDNDIIGGNSGSPVVNGSGAVVGIAFDGNIHTNSGTYWFDAERNRMISVHPAFLKEVLTKIYGATTVYEELSGH